MVCVVLLGTGTPNPDPARCGSGVAVVAGDRWLLVDCGRGVTQRVLQAGLDLGQLDAVALTHHHSDHVSDLASLAISRWVAGGSEPLTVLAPNGPCGRFAQGCLDGFEDEAFYSQGPTTGPTRPAVRVIDFDPAPAPKVVFDVGQWSVSAALVDHHPIEAAVGYRIVTDDRVVAISGDTAVCEGVELLAVGADVLIHEAVRSDRCSPTLLEWNASAFSVGVLADSLNIPTTVLTHLLPAPNTEPDERAFLAEIRSSGYTGEVIIATDLMRIDLKSSE
ncbi:MAG: rnz [Ilumatobacteraceae bacterium]|nr:rnz [Ilumatobacteraceae bacterium]